MRVIFLYGYNMQMHGSSCGEGDDFTIIYRKGFNRKAQWLISKCDMNQHKTQQLQLLQTRYSG